MDKPCTFSEGSCINCGAAEQGECEGWHSSALTDEQIDALLKAVTTDTPFRWRVFARVIEAAHGIKELNNDPQT